MPIIDDTPTAPDAPAPSVRTPESSCRIRVLPTVLVNKIAAGEVIERPASVVKELVENAIDAGAVRVAVTVEDGGRQLIRVTDDGCGMLPEELRLAVAPHATSKLITEDDLYHIGTLGFRGEALASISSVSKLRIVSRPTASDIGHEIVVAAEQVDSSLSSGSPVGTTVEVRDLFFNVPARRKFLRGSSTEVSHVNEQMSRIALAYPSIAFELRSQSRLVQNLPACTTRLERVAKFYGPELAEALLHVHRSERGLDIDAFAATPAHSRATAQWQYVYVNGRYIRDKFIQHAIKESYRGLMEPNRHGVVFLFLQIDPALIDVNVHPTKIEVRWADSNLVHSQVLSALREAFQRADLSPHLRTDRARMPLPPEVEERMRAELADVMKAQLAEQSGALFGTSPSDSGSFDRPTSAHGNDSYSPDSGSSVSGPFSRSASDVLAPNDPLASWRALYGASTVPAYGTTGTPRPDALQSPFPSHPFPPRFNPDDFNRPKAVQMHNLYLVAETDEGIIIIDQHALHERVIYEQLRLRMATGNLESQRLLLPESVRATPQQIAAIEQHAALLLTLGIEADAFGTDSIAIHAFPSLLKDSDIPAFMRDLLDHLSQQPAGSSTEVVIHKILDMMACKAAVKAGDQLAPEEIEALMRKRHLIDKATSCPHGRPTVLRLTKADLNRQFKR